MDKAINLTLLQLAELTSSKLVGDAKHLISGVDELAMATADEVSFLANARYLKAMKQSKAGAVFVAPRIPLEDHKNYLITEDPSAAFQKAIEIFCSRSKMESAFRGIHPTAIIHPTAQLGKECSIGPYAVVDQNVIVGDCTIIDSGCYIGPGVHIGPDCHLYARVVIRELCVLGTGVILQPGVIVGACGFGYLSDQKNGHTKLEQYGNVVIEDYVEIGANTTIDRARFKTTRIGRGTKIDNLVQIAHGVNIGKENLIVAQTGIAGSSKTGKQVILAGQAAVVGHVELVDHVIVAGRGGVTKSLLEAGTYAGFPATNVDEHHRQQAYARRIEKYAQRIEQLEQRLAALEKVQST